MNETSHKTGQQQRQKNLDLTSSLIAFLPSRLALLCSGVGYASEESHSRFLVYAVRAQTHLMPPLWRDGKQMHAQKGNVCWGDINAKHIRVVE